MGDNKPPHLTLDSLPPHHHHEKPVVEEHPSFQLQARVDAMLYRLIVLADGSPAFGLRWRPYDITDTISESPSHEHPHRTGGWMLKKHTAGIRGVGWKQRFCVIEDNSSYLKICKNENMDTDLVICLEDIISVKPCYSTDSDYYYVFIRTLSRKSDDQVVVLKPIEQRNHEIVTRWTALLMYRSGLFDHEMYQIRESANLIAVSLQALFRGRRDRARLQNTRHHRRFRRSDTIPGKLVSMVSRLYREPTDDAISTATDGSDNDLSTEPPKRRNSLNVQLSHQLPPLQPGEREDEIWENQRWQVVAVRGTVVNRGWGGEISLLPTDRCNYCDRLGRGRFRVPCGDTPIPANWKLAKSFAVDTSGVVNAKCDSEGWTYHTAFAQLENDFSKGAPKSQPSSLWVVRRRRWYRRLVPAVAHTPATRQPDWLVWHGWLGLCSQTTKRWKSRYCFIVRAAARNEDGVADESDLTQRPCIQSVGDHGHFSYFKYSFRQHGEDGSMMLAWNELQTKQAKFKRLYSCSVVISVASANFPGYFTVQHTPDDKPRLFNAFTSAARSELVDALQGVIASCHVATALDRARDVGDKKNFFRVAGHHVMKTVKVALKLPGDVLSSPPTPGVLNDGLHHLGRATSSIMSRSSSNGRGSTPSAQSRRYAPSEDSVFDSEVTYPTSPTVGATNPTRSLDLAQDEPTSPKVLSEDSQCSDEGSDMREVPDISQAETYKNLVLDCTLDVSVDQLDRTLFQEPEFTHALYKADRNSDVELGAWSNGSNRGSQRTVTYVMPQKGIVPCSRSILEMHYVASQPGKGYQIDVDIQNPDLPYGKIFRTQIRQTLTAIGPNKCKLVLSQQVHMLQGSIMKSFIMNGSKREVTAYYRNVWEGFLIEYLKNNGLAGRCNGEPEPVLTHDAQPTNHASMMRQATVQPIVSIPPWAWLGFWMLIVILLVQSLCIYWLIHATHRVEHKLGEMMNGLVCAAN